MSIIFLVMGLGIIGIIAYLAWTYKKQIGEIMEVRKHFHNGDAILLDQIVVDAEKRIVDCPERWTTEKQEELIPQGYIVLQKYKDKVRYAGIPVYMRLNGFVVLDLSDEETAKKFGYPKPNRIGSSAMHDFLKSNTLSRFVAGFTRVGFAPIDVKMLIMIAPILIGIVIGMAYFMGMF